MSVSPPCRDRWLPRLLFVEDAEADLAAGVHVRVKEARGEGHFGRFGRVVFGELKLDGIQTVLPQRASLAGHLALPRQHLRRAVAERLRLGHEPVRVVFAPAFTLDHESLFGE